MRRWRAALASVLAVNEGYSTTELTQDASDPWRGWNPFDPSQRDDLHAHLARLRRSDPVNQTPLGLWRLTRYADVVRLLRDVPAGVRTSDGRSYRPAAGPPDDPRERFMLLQDPPDHTRLRKLVSRAFTPRAIDRIRSRAERVVDACLDRVAGDGVLDVVADLALPVPSTVICELLGVPVSDRARFTQWTSDATHALSPNPFADPAVLARAQAAALSLRDYFERLIAQRRGRPGDDLLSDMIRAEEAGDHLSTDELLAQSIGLLIAGFETTIGLIANGIRTLILHPGELAKLRSRPDLAASAVEECLRFDGPIPATLRILHAEAEFGGRRLPKDAVVLGVLAAANRDPAVFPEPDRFDIERSPNEHLAFGGGAHYCLGAHLARLEARAAIGRFVARFDDLRLTSPTVEWGTSFFRVPGRMLVEFRASDRATTAGS
jgi:cytochrome P450